MESIEKELKPKFWRRIMAFVLDIIFVTTIMGLALWFLTPLPQLTATNGIMRFLEMNPTVIKRLDEAKAAVEELQKVELSPEELQFIETWAQSGNWQKNLQMELTNPQAFFEVLPQMANLIYEDFKTTLGSSSLPPASGRKLQDYATAVKNAAAAFQPMDLAGDFMEILLGFIFYPLVMALGYGLIEGLLGASPGKIVLGLTVASVSGGRGNFLVFMARYILKYLPYGLALAGFIFVLPFLFLSALAVELVYLFSKLGILGGRRQALYDKLSGTSVFDSKEVYESLT